MKTFFFFCLALSTLTCYSQYKNKVRSTKNEEDRKYLIGKMDSLLKGNRCKSLTTLMDKYLQSVDKELTLELSFEVEPYYELRKTFDTRGFEIAARVYVDVLHEFHQFERLTLVTKSTTEKREIKITYSFFDDNTIAFYNETEGCYVKVPFHVDAN